jgi:hypothetical protein
MPCHPTDGGASPYKGWLPLCASIRTLEKQAGLPCRRAVYELHRGIGSQAIYRRRDLKVS